jgi:hypothetical protein
MSLVLRRGRCNKIFAKYVERNVFEDSDESDFEEGPSADKKLLKKRKKKYRDVLDYLQQEVRGFDSISCFNLLRDKKYARKHMQKTYQLSVKETATKIIK